MAISESISGRVSRLNHGLLALQTLGRVVSLTNEADVSPEVDAARAVGFLVGELVDPLIELCGGVELELLQLQALVTVLRGPVDGGV
jgi:hypothetical protein